MTEIFLFGALAHQPVLDLVLDGRDAPRPATAADVRAAASPDAPLPGLRSAEGTVAGLLVTADDAMLAARLDFLARAFGLQRNPVTVTDAAGFARPAAALCARVPPGAPDWGADGWRQRWAATLVEGVGDVMGQLGQADPKRLHRRLPQILTRAGARVRAAQTRSGTASLRHLAAPGDVLTERRARPYNGYFAVEEHDLTHRRFDGTMSPVLNRAVFVSGDAAIVLPYDPVRDRVMLIEQFRAGPYVRGDANPWLLEAIAGRIDGGETPEAAALREAEEEAGLTIRRLIAGPRYYPTPGAKAEYIYSFVGLADLPDGVAGLGGLADEAEDIRSHIISFARLMGLLASGEIDNAPLMLIALWLDRERPTLRDA